jgi:hypothetical protein
VDAGDFPSGDRDNQAVAHPVSLDCPRFAETDMLAESRERFRILGLSPKPAWAEVWHLWSVIVPRRSITGRLLTGQVWRRHDGRRWIYKKFQEFQ